MDLTLEFNTPLKKVADVQNELLIMLQSEKNIITDSSKCSKSDISRLMDTTISDIMKNIKYM